MQCKELGYLSCLPPIKKRMLCLQLHELWLLMYIFLYLDALQ